MRLYTTIYTLFIDLYCTSIIYIYLSKACGKCRTVPGELGAERLDVFVMELYFPLCEQEGKTVAKLSQSGARMENNGAKMEPTWLQNRSQMIHGPPRMPRAAQERPQTAQERPNRAQGIARSSQGRSTGGQGPPKSSPRAPQSDQRARQERPKSALDVPKSLQKWVGEGSLGVTRKLKEKVSKQTCLKTIKCVKPS